MERLTVDDRCRLAIVIRKSILIKEGKTESLRNLEDPTLKPECPVLDGVYAFESLLNLHREAANEILEEMEQKMDVHGSHLKSLMRDEQSRSVERLARMFVQHLILHLFPQESWSENILDEETLLQARDRFGVSEFEVSDLELGQLWFEVMYELAYERGSEKAREMLL